MDSGAFGAQGNRRGGLDKIGDEAIEEDPRHRRGIGVVAGGPFSAPRGCFGNDRRPILNRTGHVLEDTVEGYGE